MATSITDLQKPAAGQPGRPRTNFASLVKKRVPLISQVLPDHLKLEQVTNQAINAVADDPRLQACDPENVFEAFMDACRLGLPVGQMGYGFLTAGHDGSCTFVPGWQGLVDLVSRTGRATAWTGAVFTGDEFEYQLGSSPYLTHRQGDNHGHPSHLTHAYAIGRIHGSDYPVIEVFTISRIERQRDTYNTAGDGHYSYYALEAYARKLPLLQVLKYLPKSTEIARAIALDSAAEFPAKPAPAEPLTKITASVIPCSDITQPPADNGGWPAKAPAFSME